MIVARKEEGLEGPMVVSMNKLVVGERVVRKGLRETPEVLVWVTGG